MVASSKSGACRRTIPTTTSTNPGAFRPMILSGKSTGYSIRSGMDLPLRLALHLFLELLEQAVHAAVRGTGPRIADRFPVQAGDGQNFAGGRREPHFLG